MGDILIFGSVMWMLVFWDDLGRHQEKFVLGEVLGFISEVLICEHILDILGLGHYQFRPGKNQIPCPSTRKASKFSREVVNPPPIP